MAGNVWNPNTPTLVGEEWFADLFGTNPGTWAQRIRSRAAETINKLSFVQTGAFLTPTPGGGPLDPNSAGQDIILVEVIPAGSEIPSGSVTTATYQPSADVAIGSGWSDESIGTTNIFNSINEGVAAYNTSDWVQIGGGTFANYDFRIGSSGFSGTGRVLKVQLRMVGWASNNVGDNTVIVGIVHVASGNFYKPSNAQVSLPNGAGSATTTTFDLGEINPKTDLPWTPADIQSFSSGTWAVRLRARGTAGLCSIQVTAVEMIVTYQTVENRVAAACWTNALGASQAAGPLVTTSFCALPGGAVSWSKPSSGDFTFLFRYPNAPLVNFLAHAFYLAWASDIRSGVEQPSPVPGVVSAIPTLDAYGQMTVCDFTTATRGRTIPLLVTTTAPATSQDSLPYYLTGDNTRYASINNTQTVTQQFTAPASATFDRLRFLVLVGNATALLTVKIKRVSDNVQFGNTVTLTALAAASLPVESNSTVIATLTGIAAVLVSGTRYYVELTSTDTTAVGSGWRTILLGDATLAGGTATFDGTTNVATVAGSAKNDLDMPFTFTTVPATPSGLTAVVTSRTLTGAAQGCGVASVRVVTVSWTPTVLGASWSRYELDRSEDLGLTWQTIAYGTSAEATATFQDQEAPRGLPVQYRVRVVRTDGSISASSAASAGVICQPLGCEMIFCSNEQPTYVVAYNREPDVVFQFLSAQRDQLLEIYGADYAVAFMESEDPGIQVPFLLTVNFGVSPTDDTVAIWSPLRRIARAPVSYVCVLDYTGSRFFAHLQFPEGDWNEPGYQYHARVVVSEIVGTPSIAVF